MLHSKNIKSNEIILTKNEHYYQKDKNGCQLPYLDTLEFVIIPSKLAILEDFESGRTQLITAIPTNKITQMLEGRLSDFNSQPPLFVLNNTAQFVSSYYVFNMLDKRLQDKRVRQAFNYALNREKLGQVVLRNQYFELGYYGVVPPIRNFFRGYDFDGVRSKGYVYNPEKAKKLLAEAGYPDGKGFGSIDIRFDVNDLNAAVADEIAQQFKNVLGINVVIDGSEYKQLSNDYDNGNGSIFRYTWTADYGSPESFLLNFYGKYVPASEKEMSPINIGRFKDAVFDKLLEKARDESNIAKQRQLFSDAEKHLIEQAPVIPLWYHGDIQISYSKVRNLLFNPLAQFTFKEVYLKEWTKEEYLDKMKK